MAKFEMDTEFVRKLAQILRRVDPIDKPILQQHDLYRRLSDRWCRYMS